MQIEYSFLNSHQAILFRKFLQSRKSSDTYLRFMKIKAMYEVSTIGVKYPKEDLHFWYEVQKYKVRVELDIGHERVIGL